MGGLQGLRLGRPTHFGKAPKVAAAVFPFLPTLGFRTALSVTDQTLLHDPASSYPIPGVLLCTSSQTRFTGRKQPLR